MVDRPEPVLVTVTRGVAFGGTSTMTVPGCPGLPGACVIVEGAVTVPDLVIVRYGVAPGGISMTTVPVWPGPEGVCVKAPCSTTSSINCSHSLQGTHNERVISSASAAQALRAPMAVGALDLSNLVGRSSDVLHLISNVDANA